jgi:hypothetical protein
VIVAAGMKMKAQRKGSSILGQNSDGQRRRRRALLRTFQLERKNRRHLLSLGHTRELVSDIFGSDVHARRVLSLANGVAGVLNAAVLSIHAIGQAYARLAKVTGKSGIKQIDRLLGNDRLIIDQVLELWVRYVVGSHPSLLVALDWTDFDDDDHTTLCAYLVTTHGRAMPLLWKTVAKSTLKGRRNGYENELLERLRQAVPQNVQVTILADRGFGDQKRYEHLRGLGFDFVIRFRERIRLSDQWGASKPASEWIPSSGRATRLKEMSVTDDFYVLPAVVVVHDRRMKEAWCLACSRADLSASEIVKLYGRRFSIEETFRDQKDLHFGMGLRATHIRSGDRRDRLLLLVAIAHTLLTLLGAASEASGLDRYLKANTVKRRTHSLYRQGLYWYECLPTMREEWLERLMTAYDRIVGEHEFFSQVFAYPVPQKKAEK